MWRFVSGVSNPNKTPESIPENVNSDSTKTKAATCKVYNRNYDKTRRSRDFKPKWQIGRPWLDNVDVGMICTVCIEHEEILQRQGLLKSRKFIDGCKSMKSESISIHEKSGAHNLASKIATLAFFSFSNFCGTRFARIFTGPVSSNQDQWP